MARQVERMCEQARGRIPRRRILCPTCRHSSWTPNFELDEFAHVNWVLENPTEEEEEEVPAVVVVDMDQTPVVPAAEEMEDIIFLD
ncbi:unnamed protein product [Caenorhabditis brenneri]